MLGSDIASKRKRTRQDYRYFLEYRLRWDDNDIFGHMNNPKYGVLCDSIANQYLIDECGYKTSKSPQAAIIVNTYFDYFGSVEYPSVIDIGLRVAKLGKTSVVYEVGVFKKGDEAVKAVGGSMHVWVEAKDGILGRPSEQGMPSHVREGYLALTEEAGLKLKI
ncbi:acyl-CoA thioester hydrolase [Exophiala aquamarina CBS 119918]|uniref:Acyl-CoA thioester hydrolase n=1 Tax=Exophiala aquamarina CBS 119918 TaxID=1182545 RepID=A0A072P954_9EURO|nr:acyl-CoA thioester hydrolase [Exophiala aquamarina CBS 119918]KEF56659.1 acyl-CoA thioester hydrolase [Exophiala aquamarina CBS 119918]